MRPHERIALIRACHAEPTDRHLLRAISDYLQTDDNAPAWPSAPTLARDTGLALSVVRKRLGGMTAAGIIRREQGPRTLRIWVDWLALESYRPAASKRGGAKTPPVFGSPSGVRPSEDRTPVDAVSLRSSEGDPSGLRRPPLRSSEGTPPVTGPDQIIEQIKEQIRGTDQVACASATPADGHPGSGSESVTPGSLSKRVVVGIDYAWPNSVMLAKVSMDGVLSELEFIGWPPDDSHRPDDNDGAQTPPPVASHPLPSPPGRPADVPPAAPTAIAESSGGSPRAQSDAAGGADGLLFAATGKPKKAKKAKTGEPSAAELEAWGTICQHWQALTGRLSAMQPGAGNGATILDALRKVGAAKLTARFAAVVDGRLPAAARFREMWARSTVDPAQLCRTTGGALLPDLDRQIEQAALDAAQIGAAGPSGASEDVGRVLTRPESPERPQRPASHARTPAGAWDDMLATVRATTGFRTSIGLRGSTLSHDPAEHERRRAACAAVGGWSRLCDMSEHTAGIVRSQWMAAYGGVTA